MTVYKKRVSTRNPRFSNRAIIMMFGNDDFLFNCGKPDSLSYQKIDDTEVICNSCNGNIYDEKEETFGWLIYLDKHALNADEPYDFYCDECVSRMWPEAVEVSS